MKTDRIQGGDTMIWYPTTTDHDGSLPARVVTVVHTGDGHGAGICVVDERGCEFAVSASELVPEGQEVPVMPEVFRG